MDIQKITAMLALADASLALYRAERALENAKWEYYEVWRNIESDGAPYRVDKEDRITRGSSRWDYAVAETKAEYDVFQLAKRAAYNAKRRWQTSCKKASEA